MYFDTNLTPDALIEWRHSEGKLRLADVTITHVNGTVRGHQEDYRCYIDMGCIKPLPGYADLLNRLCSGEYIFSKVLVSTSEATEIVLNCYRKFYLTPNSQQNEWHIPISLIDGYEYYTPNSDTYLRFTDFNEAVEFVRNVHVKQLGHTR